MHALKQTPEDARNALVVQYFPMVRGVANKVCKRVPREVDVDDLISVGVTGLITAIERYDAGRSVPFATYARHRVHGAMLDSLRAVDWVPRSVRRKVELLEDARKTLNDRLGRSPSREEMAQYLSLSLEDYDRMQDSALLRQVVSLDTPVGEEGDIKMIDTVPDPIDPTELCERNERLRLVADAMDVIPEREREALCLYYFHDLSLKETGRVLGVTESRACQLCAKAVNRVKLRVGKLAA